MNSFRRTLASDARLNGGDERIDRFACRREPEAVVDGVGVHPSHVLLDALEIARDDELLELTMRGVQHHSGGSLVDLARLDPHQPVLDHVDAADAVRAGDRFERLDQFDQRHVDPVGANRHAALEVELDVGRFVRTMLRRSGQRVDVVGRLLPRILQHAAFD